MHGVILLAGTNDLSTAQPDVIFKNLEALVEVAGERSDWVCVLLIPPMHAEKSTQYIQETRVSVNKMLADRLDHHDTGLVLTLDKLWDDGIHPSIEGQKTIAKNVHEWMTNNVPLDQVSATHHHKTKFQ